MTEYTTLTTQNYVDNAIATALEGIPSPDLSLYATTTALNSGLEGKEIGSLLNQYYFSPVSSGNHDNFTPNIYRVYVLPFRMRGNNFNRIGFYCELAGGNFRLGIYSNLDGAPHTLLFDSGSQVLVSGATHQASFSVDTDIEWVWGAVIFNNFPYVSTRSISPSIFTGFSSATLPYAGIFNQSQGTFELPSTFTGTSIDNESIPAIFMRRQ